MQHYFIPSDYAQRARKNLIACKMGNHNVTEYIDAFRKHFVCCSDVHEAEAKFLFKNNIADWLAAYVLPYNSKTLADIMLCAERIGGI